MICLAIYRPPERLVSPERVPEVQRVLRNLRRRNGLTQNQLNEVLKFDVREVERSSLVDITKAEHVFDEITSLGAKKKKDLEKFMRAVGILGAFGRTAKTASETVDPLSQETLYNPLHSFYNLWRLNGVNTLVVGSGWGEEIEKGFKGTLVDLDFEGLRHSRKRLGNRQVVQADAGELPFPDNSFDKVVLSFVLSQVEWIYEPYRKKILDECMRVANTVLFVIDTVREVVVKPPRYEEEEPRFDHSQMIDIPALLEGTTYFTPDMDVSGNDSRNFGKEFNWINYSSGGVTRILVVQGFGVKMDEKRFADLLL